jgi:pyruvate/2-oxoglutarate dehydrogenase complex dihydrolipoamide acyltransferase (E2) component
LTSTLNYGVIAPDGSVDVRLTYDHRVLDGATVARALADLERVLNCEILAELRYLRCAEAA